jgi:ribosomal protein L44E
MESVEEGRKKSLEARQRETRRRNQENLGKIEHLLAEKRNKLTKR